MAGTLQTVKFKWGRSRDLIVNFINRSCRCFINPQKLHWKDIKFFKLHKKQQPMHGLISVYRFYKFSKCIEKLLIETAKSVYVLSLIYICCLWGIIDFILADVANSLLPSSQDHKECCMSYLDINIGQWDIYTLSLLLKLVWFLLSVLLFYSLK